MDDAQKASRDMRGHVSRRDGVEIDAMVVEVDRLLERKQLTESLEMATLIVERHPQRREGYSRMARVLMAMKRFDEARAVIDEGLARFPSNAQLLLMAMTTARKFGEMETLLMYARDLIKFHPDRKDGYGKAIQALTALHRLREAGVLVQEALRRFPDWPRAIEFASELSRLRGRRDESFAYCRQLIARHEDEPAGYFRAIQDLLAQDRLDEASELANTARSVLPESTSILFAALDVARTCSDLTTARQLLAVAAGDRSSDWTEMRAAQFVAAMESEHDAQRTLSRAYGALTLRRSSDQSQATVPVQNALRLQRHGASRGRRVYVLTRFSIFDPGFGGFQALKETTSSSAYLASLFSSQRMAFKFKVFESVTIPSVLGQDDQDFTWLITASDRMPEPERQRLLAIAQDHRNVEVHFVASMAPLFLMRFGDDEVTIRLDDDDELRSDFVSRVRHSSQRPGTLLSFPWGRKFEWTDEGMRRAPNGFYVPNNAQGLAAFGMNVFGCGRHTTVDEAYEVVYDYTPDMFSVCCSEFCDTNRWFPQDTTSPE